MNDSTILNSPKIKTKNWGSTILTISCCPKSIEHLLLVTMLNKCSSVNKSQILFYGIQKQLSTWSYGIIDNKQLTIIQACLSNRF